MEGFGEVWGRLLMLLRFFKRFREELFDDLASLQEVLGRFLICAGEVLERFSVGFGEVLERFCEVG